MPRSREHPAIFGTGEVAASTVVMTGGSEVSSVTTMVDQLGSRDLVE